MPGPRERSGGQAPEVPWPLGAFTTVPARRPLGGLLWWSRGQFFHWLDTLRARTARRPGSSSATPGERGAICRRLSHISWHPGARHGTCL